MNELLISEIKSQDKDLLQLLVLIEEEFGESKSINNALAMSFKSLELIIEQCHAVISEIDAPLERAESLLNELYFSHLFIDSYQTTWPVESYSISGLNHRLMSPIVKAALVKEIIFSCGFDADLVFVPNKIMVRICCDEEYAIVFDAVTGESLNWHELDLRLDDLDGDPSQHELLTVDNQALLVEHLTSLKNSLVREQSFAISLKCIDIILSLTPDDPLQRRDRGFLLHQLDCFNVAVDDYRYFVEQCPKDPAAKILKLQLDKINLVDNVLH
jgi:regulator of sirC expression with transglutaminase-like and TPR domain